MNKLMKTMAAILLASAAMGRADEPAFKVDTIPTPKGVAAEVGGLDITPSGKVAACLHDGQVWMYDPASGKWSQFAEGLHDPLGLYAKSDDELIIMQRPELTRLRDSDGDGAADEYMTITDDFGMTGNYHEFAFGPAVDKDGNYFIAMNCASSGAGVRFEKRGEFHANWYDGRMYSCVPWRGWVLRVSPAGKVTPWAHGFRSPDGIGFDSSGDLFITDNQGDWLGTSKLFLVKRGAFHGHPASRVWTEGFEGKPLDRSAEELDAMRRRATVLFPHGIMANSPTQPIEIPERFGVFGGQLLVGEMNSARLLRVMLDEVDGHTQGACVVLLDNGGLAKGDHRFAFDADGALWIGMTTRGYWVGDNGLKRVQFTGHTPLDVQTMKLTREGFELTFTKPVDAKTATAEHFAFERYRYEYHDKYGSPQMDKQSVAVKKLTLSEGGRTATVALDPMKAGFVYEMQLKDVRGEGGEAVANPVVCYTLDKLSDK
jgi:glucose/arabinose dehydrogenase